MKKYLLVTFSLFSIIFAGYHFYPSQKEKTVVPVAQKTGVNKLKSLRMQKLEKKIIRLKSGTYRPKSKRFDKPKQAEEFRTLQRRNRHRQIPSHNYIPARQQLSSSRSLATRAIGGWTFLGPGNIGGRTRALVIHPTQSNIMYAGGVGGGVWKTEDGGNSWRALNDFMANLAVCTLALDPDDPNIIFAGTGEGYFNGDSRRGDGIFRSLDGGATWSQVATGSQVSYYINKIWISKQTGNNRIWAAGFRPGNLWLSLDNGATWASQSTFSPNGLLEMVVYQSGSTDHVYVFNAGDKLYRYSYNGTGTLTPINTITGWRGALAIDQTNGVGYCVLAGNSPIGKLSGVYRLTNPGASETWTSVLNTGQVVNTILLSNSIYYGGYHQGWYDNVVAIDPTDPNRVFVGGVDIFRSSDGGKNWSLLSHWWSYSQPNSPGYMHADQHAIVFHPSYNGTTNTTIYFGNDGGIYRSSNPLATAAVGMISPNGSGISGTFSQVDYTPLNNNYGVTQFYYGAASADGSIVAAGAQDNGTVKNTNGVQGWQLINGGDGGWTAIDQDNANIIYASYTNGTIYKSTNGGANFTKKTSGLGGSFLFIAPGAMAPGNSRKLLLGGTTLFRTQDGIDTPWQSAGLTIGERISCITITQSNNDYVYVGTEQGNVYRSNDTFSAGFPTWNQVITGLPTPGTGRYIKGIAIHPLDINIVYAVYSSWGVPGGQVWRTMDGGANWAAVSNGLPDLPVTSVLFYPRGGKAVYIGTDLGLLASYNADITDAANVSWNNLNNPGTGGKFANVPVDDLFFQPMTASNTHRLFAFSHGRGAFSLAVNNPPFPPEKVSPKNSANVSGTTVTFTWKPTTDPDGDAVKYLLYVSSDSTFSATPPIIVAKNDLPNKKYQYASAGMINVVFASCLGLLLIGIFVRRPGRRTICILLIMTVVGLGGCIFQSSRKSSKSNLTYTMTLTSGSTYYWKVQADDGNGGIAESSVWNFVTP